MRTTPNKALRFPNGAHGAPYIKGLALLNSGSGLSCIWEMQLNNKANLKTYVKT